MQSDDQLKAWILNKLKRHKRIGGRHTEGKNVRKGAPPMYYKRIDGLLEQLIKKNRLIMAAGKARERHVSLHPRFLGEIDSFIRQHYVEVIF